MPKAAKMAEIPESPRSKISLKLQKMPEVREFPEV
jgi:hypothetical protein